MMVSRTEMNGLVIATKLIDLSLASMRELPSSVNFCLDYECTISADDSENGLLKPYLANRRAVVKGNGWMYISFSHAWYWRYIYVARKT